MEYPFESAHTCFCAFFLSFYDFLFQFEIIFKFIVIKRNIILTFAPDFINASKRTHII